MYNPNYGYSPAPSHQQPISAPLSSTPSNARPQRPRFGYPGPADYPRPRSSASKPNPEGYPKPESDPYRNSDDCLDIMRSKYPTTSNYSSSYQGEYPEAENYVGSPTKNSYEGYMNSFNRSIYGGVTDNCVNTPPRSSFGNSDGYVDNMRGAMDNMVNNYGNSHNRGMDISFSPMNNSFHSNNSSTHSQNTTAYYTCNESFYESPKKPLLIGNSPYYSPYSDYSPDNRPDFQGRFQNKKDKFKANSSLAIKPKSIIYDKKRVPANKKPMASKSDLRCTVCCIDFTSSIPYDMHLRGAKHAKKLKLREALESIKSQVAQSKEIAPVGKSFRCDLCSITANSSLQLQTHLDGTKHKNKLSQLKQSKEKILEKEAESEPAVNGKSNGAAVVRPLPTEFGEPQQAKMCKFSCDICNIIVNSEIQLQQHLISKKHQAKVEGKPYVKRKFKQKKDDEDGEKAETEQKTEDNATESSAATETTTQEPAAIDTEMEAETSNAGEARKMVVGVKTLSSSFVQGDTLQ